MPAAKVKKYLHKNKAVLAKGKRLPNISQYNQGEGQRIKMKKQIYTSGCYVQTPPLPSSLRSRLFSLVMISRREMCVGMILKKVKLFIEKTFKHFEFELEQLSKCKKIGFFKKVFK
jgi:hypothetical protein